MEEVTRCPCRCRLCGVGNRERADDEKRETESRVNYNTGSLLDTRTVDPYEVQLVKRLDDGQRSTITGNG
jgi:hypothetical protein